jgi:phosphoglycolate phosphatase-like HAD superfamily hydrolase
MTILFCWDFHGVLEKGNEVALVEVTNKVLDKFGFKVKLTLEQCKKLYGLKWGIFFEKLVPSASKNDILKMVNRGIEISNTTNIIEQYVKPMDNSIEVLNKIVENGHENIILSNTEPKALNKYINAVGIKTYITKKIGADVHRKEDLHKNSKIDYLKQYLTSKTFEKVVVIGDRDTDIEVGKSVGATTYLFLNGFNEKTDADYCIEDLRELLVEIK